MFDFLIVSLITIAPYNVEAFLLLRLIWIMQLYYTRFYAFLLGATVAPTIIR